MSADEARAELEARLWKLWSAPRETATLHVDSALRAADAYAAECDIARLEWAEAQLAGRQAERRAALLEAVTA